MSRDEFIITYMGRSEITDFTVSGNMVEFDGFTMLAEPCACGEADCAGWQMTLQRSSSDAGE